MNAERYRQLELALAKMEWEKARVGYGVWNLYVAQCERELGIPWGDIRERFDLLHRRGETNHPGVPPRV